MIVKDRLDFVSITCHASDMSASAHTAYWTANTDEGLCAYHGKSVIQSFEKIAALLGYRVEKILQPVEAPEAAE